MKNKELKEVKNLVDSVNLSGNLFKYPFGNRELTEELKKYENLNLITYCNFRSVWMVVK